MARVSFKTKGKTVSFQSTGKRKRQRGRKPNAYALYVKKHIGKFLAKGMSAPAAMRAVARQYQGR